MNAAFSIKHFHYESDDRLRQDLGDFLDAYSVVRRPKTLRGLTPYESICNAWTSEPERFILGPIHHLPELNI